MSFKNIVIDIGGSKVKVGFSTDDSPRFVFPSVVGHPVNKKGDIIKSEPAVCGFDALSSRENLKWKYFFSRGVVLSWDDFDLAMEYSFSKLDVDPKETRVLFVVPPFVIPMCIKNLLSTFLVKFRVAEVSFVDSTHLALISVGKRTGITVSMGADMTITAGYYDGFTVEKTTVRMNVGGSDVSQHLACLLSKQFDVWKLSPVSIDGIKEDLCYIPVDFDTELKKCKSCSFFQAKYNVEKKEIVLNEERVLSPQILFENASTWGVCKMLEHSIRNYLRQIFDKTTPIFENIFLFGGTGRMKGMARRLERDLKKAFPREKKIRVNVLDKHASWRGGAKIMESGQVDHTFLAREDYSKNFSVKGFFSIRLSSDCHVMVKTFNLDSSMVEKKFWRNERSVQNIGQIARTFETQIEGIKEKSAKMEDEYLDYLLDLEGTYKEKMQETSMEVKSLAESLRAGKEKQESQQKVIVFLKEQVSKLEKEIASEKKLHQMKYNQMKKANEKLRNINEKLAKENVSLHDYAVKIKGKLEKNNSQMKHLHQKCKRLEDEFEEKNKELDLEYKAKKLKFDQEYDVQLAKTKEKCKKLKAKLKKMESSYKQKLMDFQRIEDTEDSSSSVYLKRKNERLDFMNQKLTKENEDLRKKMQSMEEYYSKKASAPKSGGMKSLPKSFSSLSKGGLKKKKKKKVVKKSARRTTKKKL